MPWAYYNEWDEPTAAWLRELISRGLIADGDVDTRSITEVSPDDVKGFTQAHFFAGIGGWSHALRLAGWPDDRPVWTGSPPCQPFSMAGQRRGYDDERHLAPQWLDLVKVCAPDRIFGEQVSGAISKGWLDALQHEMEAEGYACGAVVLASCGVGAPNIRRRLYFAAERLGDGDGEGSQGRLGSRCGQDQQPAGARGLADGVGNADSNGRRGSRFGPAGTAPSGVQSADWQRQRLRAYLRPTSAADVGERPGPVNGFWRDADWLACRDGAWRPVEPGAEPLADGIPARVVRLRGYGNAINPVVAAAFIQAFEEGITT